MIFDSHAHYNDKAFEEDRAQLLASLSFQRVGAVCEIGYDRESSQAAVRLAEQYGEETEEKKRLDGVREEQCGAEGQEERMTDARDGQSRLKHQEEVCRPQIFAAVGIHPEEAGKAVPADLEVLRALAGHPKVVAIGEIGLDYYWPEPDHEIQKHWFRQQLALARELKMPVVIHSRDAAQDTYEILAETQAAEYGGILHCFSYTKEMAERFLKLGWYIGIGGVLTFKNAKKLREAAELIPLSRIVLETDCPYMAPEPNRGKRNDSGNLIYVAEKLAEIKGVSLEEVIRITTENTKRVYRLIW